jgi:cytochrome c oxidase subunit 1
MHFLGLNGMPRRTWTYDANMGWSQGNLVATIGAYLLGLGILIYIAVAVWSYFNGEEAGPDPWDARTLEWSIPSPPPEYNFAVIPTVHARDAWWYEKSHPEEIAREKTAHAREEAAHGGIHLPDQSWYPLVAAAGLLTAGLCFANDNFVGAIAGGAILFAGIYLWSLEGPGGYYVHPESPADAASPSSPRLPSVHEQPRRHRLPRPSTRAADGHRHS